MDLKEIREALQHPEIITENGEVITGDLVKFKDVIDLEPRLNAISALSDYTEAETLMTALVEETCKRLNMEKAIPHILELPLGVQNLVLSDFFACLKFGKPKSRTS